MQYITSVEDVNYTKHIIEFLGKTHEVVECPCAGKYGDREGKTYYACGNVNVYEDLLVTFISPLNGVHLSEIVSAIEKVRFIIESLKKAP